MKTVIAKQNAILLLFQEISHQTEVRKFQSTPYTNPEGPLSVTNNQTQNKHRTIICLIWNTAVTHMFIIFKMWEILKTWKLGLIRRPNSRSCEGLRLSDKNFFGPSVKFNLFWQILKNCRQIHTKLPINWHAALYKSKDTFWLFAYFY